MEKIEYQQFGETLYRVTLQNGLQVNLLPKNDFHKTYGVMTANYGSLDNTFVPAKGTEFVKVPDGIAHFLEHKLFEKEDYDAFELFGKYGAEANAFTSFTKTSYLFSATNNVKKCVEILLDFVQQPYFSEQTVAKEKGIIAEEIKMYDDDPSWRLYFGMIGNLYPNTALSIDIAGSVESIGQITTEDLYICYQTFYQPQNMSLFLVGNFDIYEILATIEANQAQKQFPAPQEIKRPKLEVDSSGSDIIPYRMLELNVNRPKTMVGIKGLDEVSTTKAGLKYKLAVELLLYLLYSESAPEYLKLYQQGILDDSFGYEFTFERGFHFAVISGDSDQPQALSNAIIEIAENAVGSLSNRQAEFELAQREFIGRYIQAMNSLEAIANRYSADLFEGATVFELVPVIEELTLEDIIAAAKSFIKPEAISVFQILPKG